jgi:hypothetical protein
MLIAGSAWSSLQYFKLLLYEDGEQNEKTTSFRRRPESSLDIVPRSGQAVFLGVVTLRVCSIIVWIPAFAGMTDAVYPSVMS